MPPCDVFFIAARIRVKLTQVFHAQEVIHKNKDGTLKGIGNLNSALENADSLLEQKLTCSQFHQIAPLTL
jgi:hypothetical protein